MIACQAALSDLQRRCPDVTIVCCGDTTRLPGNFNLGAVCSHTHVQLADRLVAGLDGALAPERSTTGALRCATMRAPARA